MTQPQVWKESLRTKYESAHSDINKIFEHAFNRQGYLMTIQHQVAEDQHKDRSCFG